MTRTPQLGSCELCWPGARASVINTQLWPRPDADVLPRGKGRRGQPGLAGSKPADFHDHEDFSVLCRIKVFAIMKLSLPGSD